MSMISRFGIAVCAIICLVTLAPRSLGATNWQWELADPVNSQLLATRTNTGIVSIALVHLINGCQEPFFVPGKAKLQYTLKIRTEEGVMCTQVIRDEYALYFEKGTAATVRVQTKSGVQRVTVKQAPTSAPTP